MILNIIRDVYHHLLYTNHKYAVKAREYLYQRGLTDRTIKHFQLGYGRNWHAYNALNRLGIDHDQILASDMFYQTEDLKVLERFNGLITIPVIYDGITVHFTGRAVGNEWVARKMFSPHMHRPGGFPCAFNEVYDNNYKYLILVESPIDCMTLWQHKFNGIATFGISGVTTKVAERIREHYKKVFIAYDSEPNQSGLKGAERMSGIFYKMGISSRIVQWPESETKMDVNAFFIDHNRNDFLDLLNTSQVHIPEEKQKKNFVRIAVEMEKIARKYFTLREVSRGYMVPCPYHKDSKPSMHLFTDTNEFYCYGCGRTGGAFQLLLYMEQIQGNTLSNKEALQLYHSL